MLKGPILVSESIPFNVWLKDQLTAGTTRAQLAKAAGLSKPTMTRLVRGGSEPLLRTAIRLGYVHPPTRAGES